LSKSIKVAAIIFLVLLLDQTIKIWVKTTLSYGEEFQMLGLNWARIHFVENPGMAFGTGTHPTTQLCLEALEEYTQSGMNVLDLGTGSAILAIAAAKLGAVHVLGLDTDPVAVEVAIKNVAESGVSDVITIQEGSLENVITSARRFDLIVVNILARIIIQMCDEHLGDVVRPGGLAIFSGIIQSQADDVDVALAKTGLQVTRRRIQCDWVVIEARRPHL